jgi:hypothetical protein
MNNICSNTIFERPCRWKPTETGHIMDFVYQVLRIIITARWRLTTMIFRRFLLCVEQLVLAHILTAEDDIPPKPVQRSPEHTAWTSW